MVQRTSSDLRLNPHLHVVFLDGAYSEQEAQITWQPLGHLQTREVGQVLQRVVQRIDKHLRRHGLFHSADQDAERQDAEDQLAASAVSGQAPPAGPQWRRGLSPLMAAPLGYDKPLCAALDGCGGCNAEFYDTFGHAVCEDPSECRNDADCPQGSWCRQAQSNEDAPIYECAPFVGEGARCHGFTPPWLYERCEPGLTCDTPDGVDDATGICRRTCDSSRDCKEPSYCASDKLCDDDGACERHLDCALPGNTYGHIACVGHGICVDQRCGWECDSPEFDPIGSAPDN